MNDAFVIQPEFKKSVLKNGVRVVTEHHPGSRSVCAGIFVDLGSRDEPDVLNGAAHFVEHMVFKGTKSRTAMDIAKSLEAVGGELNAYTSQEYTCFHATSLREHLSYCVDVLADLVSHATFDPVELEKERQVIMHEIDMSAEELEEYIFDQYFEHAYKGHHLGRSILGSKETLNSINRKSLYDFYHSRYHGKEMVVSVAGHVDHDEVVSLVEQRLTARRKAFKVPARTKPKTKRFKSVLKKPSEQIHCLMGFPSSTFKDKFRFEAYIANAVLGGGMTSRLYQKIREKHALAYSVYSYLHTFSDSGMIMIYAGTVEDNLKKVIDSIYKEIERLHGKGISQKDLKFFKRQVKGNILLNADDVENRMNSLGVNEMVFGKYRPVDDVIKDIDAVSCDSLRAYIDKYVRPEKLNYLAIGDTDEAKIMKEFDRHY